MIAICPDFFTIGLEKQFRRILKKRQSQTGQTLSGEKTVQDVSQIGLDNNPATFNPKIKVQAIDFRHWQGRCLGIMITPWFMNLMLLPNEGDEWQDKPLGTKTAFEFPSGRYEFILTEEEGIGRFQMHPVFQLMSQFSNQESAVKLAQQGLLAIMREGDTGATLCHLQQILSR